MNSALLQTTRSLRSALLARPILAHRLLTTSSIRASSSSSSTDSDLTHPALLKDPPAENPSTATDPWTLQPPPLPPSPMPEMTMSQLMSTPHPEGRDEEPVEVLRKRLVYESRKRGILEMDLILSTFAKKWLAELSERELREYDRFLTLPDWSLYYYVTGKAPAPQPWKRSWVLQALLDHAENRGRSIRRMPDLDTKA
ncbi:BZ3500_MvSof-1268-A1-R1_Chr3-1g05947 [Microbotryum saponariae]|uniref:Succinate dehydrogenase assembly factor 2, mitochondrial n=1 Tax=Microbotryum saponariae TaxID=289078 RepID=A0A2X0NIP1_9BASI|nr:BZ3500_MvSof-1268-A1-R1_Chr3-1g05947 [Microbotryum saponariae]SDA05137.1 BZ3501_MvSof-1269-A2-R1_Chr3-1g05617 [Microbotryum saponariae]